MKPIIDTLYSLDSEVVAAIEQLDLSTKKDDLRGLEEKIAKPDFWNDRAEAEQVSSQAAGLRRYIEGWEQLADEVHTTYELAQMDEGASPEDYEKTVGELQARVDQAMITLKLSGEFDNSPAIMQISAGVGGTDAQDWAQMLMEMYVKYGNMQDWTVEVVDVSHGEEAGIKSATLEFRGQFAYGKLKSEKGVHRLVRLSPFNSDNLRQTSFALVDVVPELPENEATIDEKDLKIDTYRSSGHGGQSVNTTDSAVRITHIPTGTVVAIQNERSQLKNKQKAMSILASKLAELAREQHLESIAELRGKLKSADWGAQIRSYVLHPYTKVKDHRTDFETSDANGVLAGKLDGFVEAYLKSQIGD